MSDCGTVERLAPMYVDGESSPADAERLEAHLRVCGACRGRVAAERSVQAVLASRRALLQSAAAPPGLRARCAGRTRVSAEISTPSTAPWHARAWPLALAATVILAVGVVALNVATRTSVRVMAAELAADHVKCAMVNAVLGTEHDHDHEDIEQWLASAFSWEANLPDAPHEAGLELVGARTCLYGQGRVAHVMYRYDGRPVSVFMLPGTERAQDVVETQVLGHRETVWSADGRTFVLVAEEPEVETRRLASFVRAALE